MIDMSGKIVAVTGATSGIGRATVLALARMGTHLVVNARSTEQLQALVDEVSALGGQAIAAPGDVAREETAAHIVATAVQEFGGLDAAFNNVGSLGKIASITELSADAWRQTLDTNLDSVFFGIKHQAPEIAKRGGGSIVCCSSVVGFSVGVQGNSAYGAAKAAIVGLAKAAAVELAPKNVRVNVLVPSAVDTPANMVNFPEAGPEVRSFVEGVHLLKRLAQPEELASGVLYLLSDSSSFVTGSTLLVDGGMSVTL